LLVDAITSVGQTAAFHLKNILILWRNNYCTYWFPESWSGIWI